MSEEPPSCRIRPPAPRPRVTTKSPRRFVISSAAMLAGATLLCVWVTLVRDRNTRRVFMAAADHYRLRLQDHWDQMECLPSELPQLEDRREQAFLEVYADAETRFYATRSEEPAIAGYTHMAQLFVTYNSRGVIFFHEGRFWTEWVREGLFQHALRKQEASVQEFLDQARSVPANLPE